MFVFPEHAAPATELGTRERRPSDALVSGNDGAVRKIHTCITKRELITKCSANMKSYAEKAN